MATARTVGLGLSNDVIDHAGNDPRDQQDEHDHHFAQALQATHLSDLTAAAPRTRHRSVSVHRPSTLRAHRRGRRDLALTVGAGDKWHKGDPLVPSDPQATTTPHATSTGSRWTAKA